MSAGTVALTTCLHDRQPHPSSAADVLDPLGMRNGVRLFRLGRREYEPVWEMQKLLVEDVRSGGADALILVEHESVYTLGKNADDNHLLNSRRPEVPVYHVERGGDVTFHGPGQVVGYPILDLRRYRPSISWYMRSLEEVLIRVVRRFGLEGQRRGRMTGVWVGERKIAALGVRLSRWISMHGFALNVSTDLGYFDGIIPCGIFECGVTSLQEEFGRAVPLSVVEDAITEEFSSVFEVPVNLDVAADA